MREAASREAFRPLRESGGGAPFFFVSRSPRVEEREWIWAIPYPLSATRRFGGIHVVETTRLAISLDWEAMPPERRVGGTSPRGRAEAEFSTPGTA